MHGRHAEKDGDLLGDDVLQPRPRGRSADAGQARRRAASRAACRPTAHRCGTAAGRRESAPRPRAADGRACHRSPDIASRPRDRLAWVSIAPLGGPVVPPVYWMTRQCFRQVAERMGLVARRRCRAGRGRRDGARSCLTRSAFRAAFICAVTGSGAARHLGECRRRSASSAASWRGASPPADRARRGRA